MRCLDLVSFERYKSPRSWFLRICHFSLLRLMFFAKLLEECYLSAGSILAQKASVPGHKICCKTSDICRSISYIWHSRLIFISNGCKNGEFNLFIAGRPCQGPIPLGSQQIGFWGAAWHGKLVYYFRKKGLRVYLPKLFQYPGKFPVDKKSWFYFLTILWGKVYVSWR